MAILFVDSFDHYNTDYLDEKWTSSSLASVVAGGRCGTNCLKIALSSNDGFVVKGLSVSGPTVTVGMAVKSISGSAIAGTTHNVPILSLLAGGYRVITFMQEVDGSIKGYLNIEDPFPLSPFLSGGGLLPYDNFYFIEIKTTLDESAGSVDIQVNGLLRYSSGPIQTTNGKGTTITGIMLGHGDAFGGVTYIDDLYVTDTSDASGAGNTGFLGDVRVEALEPTADGAVQQWDLGAGASHWSAVDDGAAPDADTSYIETNTVNNVETNVHEDSALPAGSSVFGVQVTMLAKKDQPGDRLVAPVSRQGGTDYVGDDLAVNQDSYTFIHNVLEVNPATSAAWTIDEVNDSEFGVKVTQ